MDFREVLTGALKICGDQSGNPLLFYYAMCDMVGSDLMLKQQLAVFNHFNTTYHLVEIMSKNPEPRTIGLLLEKCKEQPDAPVKLCLKWIHTLFEFFYRAKHTNRSNKEQIPKAVEEDFLNSRQEGHSFYNIKYTPQVSIPNKQAPSTTSTQKVSAPSSDQAGTPPSLKTIQSKKPIIPDKAWVYIADGSPIIHVSADCPHIRPSLGLTLYRGRYERARYNDFARINNLISHTQNNHHLSRKHCPPICPKCGEFTPILSYRNPKREYKEL